jgi:hypothetical protein
VLLLLLHCSSHAAAAAGQLQPLLLLLLAAWVHAHQYLCLLKDVPADACSWSKLDEVGQQTLQGSSGGRSRRGLITLTAMGPYLDQLQTCTAQYQEM